MPRINRMVRMICLGTVLMVFLGGCSHMKKPDGGDRKLETQDPVLEGDAKESEVEKAERVENVSLEFDSTVLSIGKEEVTLREILVYMYLLKTGYEPEFGINIWDYQIEGKTFERKALEEALHMATEMKIIRREAKGVPLDLTVDETDEINVKAENFLTKVSSENRERYGLTAETLAEVFGDHEMAGKMFDVCMNQVNTQISDEEARQMVVQYLLVMTNGTIKNGVAVEMDENRKAEALESAKRLLRKAVKASSFYSFAEANTDADVVERTIGRNSMSKEFVDAAWNLKAGEFSDVVEAPEGYYVIYCVNDNDKKATNQEKERIILEEQTGVFEKQYEQWAAKYQVRISNLLWNYDFFP